MKDRVKQYIKKQQLIWKGDRVLAAVSGGADSVCLLYLLDELKEELGIELFVVHVNHGLRGKEADEDEAYVRELCHRLGLHFHAYHKDIKEIATLGGMSLEEAGRKVRYDAFVEECQRLDCNKVAVAHHMNDTAETMLFHLIRGSGLRGLSGIPAKRALGEKITVIRPLLGVKREEIESYLAAKQITFCVDQTNLENDYSRNKLRNQVIPFLQKELNEGVIEHIAKTAAYFNEINEYINHNIDSVYLKYVNAMEVDGREDIKLSSAVLEEHPVIQKELIRRILEQMLPKGLKDINAGHVEQIRELLSNGVGKRVNLPGGLLVKKQYSDLIFTFFKEELNRMNHPPFCMELNIRQPFEYELNEIGKTLRVNVIDNKKSIQIPKNAYTKWFDYDKIKNTVFLRTRQTGDYLQIKEDGGKKKLKDYFIDRKIPKEERDSYLLIADGKHIMWVLEDRTSEAYRVDATTKKILVISLIGGNNYGYQR